MVGNDGITIRPFSPPDQTTARRLILEGLGGHFGFIDESLNPDLDDIEASYTDGLFLVAECDGRIVGTGCLTRRAERGGLVQRMSNDGEALAVVRRMSTATTHRRRGVGSALLGRLVEHAGTIACDRVLLETNADWDDANRFYLAFGFQELLRADGGVAFGLAVSRRA